MLWWYGEITVFDIATTVGRHVMKTDLDTKVPLS